MSKLNLKSKKTRLLISTVILIVLTVAISSYAAVKLLHNNDSSNNLVRISSISPSSGPVNTRITITGSDFTDNNYIEIAGGYYPVGASTANGTVITFSLPSQFEDGSGCFGPPFSKNQATVHCDAIREVLVYPNTYSFDVLTSRGKSNPVSFTVSQ